MLKERPILVMLFCGVVTLCTAVLKFLDPDFSFYDGGLITSVLLTILVPAQWITLLFGGISLLIVGVTMALPHNGFSNTQMLMQHLFSAIVITMCTLLITYLKRLYDSLANEQQQIKALFENSTEGIFLTDAKGKILLVNPEGARLFDYTVDELIGMKVDQLVPMHRREGHIKLRETFHANPENRPMGNGRDLFACRKDNSTFPVEVSLSHYSSGKERFVIAFVIDISQRKEAEQELIAQKNKLEKISSDIRKLNTELENKVEERTLILKEALMELERSQEELSEALNKEKELNEIKSRFVSMASHEFRTPLSTILSSASLAGKYQKEEQQFNREKHLNRIKDAVKHMNDLLEDFLSLGKLDEGKVQSEGHMIAVAEYLNEIVEEIKTIAKPNQQIEVKVIGNTQFFTDSRLLKNSLLNLLSNALKFSDDGKVIWLTATVSETQLKVEVIDEGIGIAEEDQVHLFSSFYRAKNATNIQGTGLGLHIVQRYVQLLNGSIQLKSTLNVGTTITLIIPPLAEED